MKKRFRRKLSSDGSRNARLAEVSVYEVVEVFALTALVAPIQFAQQSPVLT
jgi:hypothetical protein